MKLEIFSKLKGNNRFETAENYSILFIFVGAIAFSAGIGLNILNTRGFSTILAMLGALVSFLSTVALIAIWVVKEFENESVEK